MSSRLEFAIRTAREAGDLSLAHFGSVHVEYKSDATPVTVADREVEAHIRQELARAYPGEDCFGEEEGGSSSSTRWLIDPIDGTKSFACGVPLYATLLSFEVDGIPEVGVAHFPALGMTLSAERGHGSKMNGQPIHVSSRADMPTATFCCAGHRSFERLGWTQALADLSLACLATRTWCDAYGHALVAIGRVEAMIDPVLEPYDISAMSLIVEEAGGRCTDFAGHSWPKGGAISSNLHFHSELLERFR